MDEVTQILTALKTVRPSPTCEEYDLHHLVAQALEKAEIPFTHEAYLEKGARIDFLAGTIGIEVKKRAARATIMKQIGRYLDSASVSCLIVATRHGVDLPAKLHGKPVYTVCLSRNWGIAI